MLITNTENKTIVKLCPYEKSLYYYSRCGDCLVIGIAVIESEKRTILTSLLVRHALNYLKNRHPLLRAYLEHDKESDEVYLVMRDDIISFSFDEICLEWSNVYTKEALTDELEKFNSKKFEYEKKSYLWRAKVVKFNEDDKDKYAVSFVLPLYLTDGLNISCILIELVNIINALLIDKECEEMKVRLELVDNLNVLTSEYKLFSDKQKWAINELRTIQNNNFILDDEFKCNELGLKINMLKLNKKLSEKLLAKAKEKNTKLTGMLNAAIVYALRDLYEENGLVFPSDLICGLPANLRIRYQPNLDFSHIRFQVCLAHFNLSRPNFGDFNDIWADARHVNELVEKCTSMEDGSLFLGTHDFESIDLFNRMFKECVDDEERACKTMNKTNHCDLILSNLGTYVSSRKKIFQGPFDIKEVYHGDSLQSSPNVISALIFHITFWNREIQILLSSNKSAMGTKYSERLINLLEQIIIKSVF